MGDLEDSIFKLNVPGKYSTWNKGQDGVEHCDSEEEKSVDDNALVVIAKVFFIVDYVASVNLWRTSRLCWTWN